MTSAMSLPSHSCIATSLSHCTDASLPHSLRHGLDRSQASKFRLPAPSQPFKGGRALKPRLSVVRGRLASGPQALPSRTPTGASDDCCSGLRRVSSCSPGAATAGASLEGAGRYVHGPGQGAEPARERLRSRSVRAHAAAAADAAAAGGGEGGGGDVAVWEQVQQFRRAFWKFLRPHTIRGTILGTTAVVARALLENSHAINWALLPKALQGLLALLCGNGYIVGINQIYDTDIDKVNKPFLPVASGEMSATVAAALCAALCVAGLGIVAAHFGPLITALYALGLFLGTIYSVPPLRLKRFALPAFLIIATVRGLLLNFGVYYATRAALGLPFQWSPAILFITVFVTLFATVIAITKDLPDVEGDKKFKIDTFATKLGVRAIAFLGSGLLVANYCGAIIAALTLPHAFRVPLMVGSHAALALSLVYQTWKLDTAKYSQDAIAGFYRFIWNLFYLEYCLLPFI